MTDSPSEPTPEEAAAGEVVASAASGPALPVDDLDAGDVAALLEGNEEGDAAAADTGDDGGPQADFAAELARAVGSDGWTAEHATVRVRVARDGWASAVASAGEMLPFFSWLSAVDWSRDVVVGEPAENADQLEERFEVLCRLSSVTDERGAILVADVPKDDAWIESIVDVFPGAGWHEREAAEMFGLDFRGNPNLAHLYLPDSFEGHPLLKSFPLLSREVKPWPGTVDVEGMPSTDNVEAGVTEGTEDVDVDSGTEGDET